MSLFFVFYTKWQKEEVFNKNYSKWLMMSEEFKDKFQPLSLAEIAAVPILESLHKPAIFEMSQLGLLDLHPFLVDLDDPFELNVISTSLSGDIIRITDFMPKGAIEKLIQIRKEFIFVYYFNYLDLKILPCDSDAIENLARFQLVDSTSGRFRIEFHTHDNEGQSRSGHVVIKI